MAVGRTDTASRGFRWPVAIVLTMLAARGVWAQAPEPVQEDARPEYQLLRAEEDWSVLRNQVRSADPFDRVKFVPIAWPASSFVSFGGEVRHRYERFTNEEWAASPADGSLLQRYMVHADLWLGGAVRLFGQLKSGIETGRNGGPRPPDEDNLDVHQAFLELRTTRGSSNRSVSFRVGRQEFNLGSGRLMSVREGPNVRQSFDAVRAVVQQGAWRADAFLARPVLTTSGAFDDRGDRGRTLVGVYATLTRWSGATVEAYYFGFSRDVAGFDQGTGNEQRHSLGMRLSQRAGALDFNTEVVGQWGAFGTSSIRAWTVAGEAAYQLTRRGQPRLGLSAGITSGDRNRHDDRLGSFHPLFPKGAYFGLIAPTGPLNHIGVHPSIAIAPVRDWSISTKWLFLWRTQRDDGLYGVPGGLLRSGEGRQSRFVGHSPGVEVEWRASRHLSMTAYAARFAAGAFLRESSTARTIVYLAAATTFRF